MLALKINNAVRTWHCQKQLHFRIFPLVQFVVQAEQTVFSAQTGHILNQTNVMHVKRVQSNDFQKLVDSISTKMEKLNDWKVVALSAMK